MNVMRRSLTLWDLLRHSKAFSWVLSCSERLLKVLSHFVTFMFFLRRSKAFSLVMSSSKKFQKVLRRSLTFWDIQRCIEVFSWVERGSQRFLKNQRNYLMFWGVLRHSQGYLEVVKVRKCYEVSLIIWSVMRRSEVCSWAMSSSESFQESRFRGWWTFYWSHLHIQTYI